MIDRFPHTQIPTLNVQGYTKVRDNSFRTIPVLKGRPRRERINSNEVVTIYTITASLNYTQFSLWQSFWAVNLDRTVRIVLEGVERTAQIVRPPNLSIVAGDIYEVTAQIETTPNQEIGPRWILATDFWSDLGVWVDTEIWEGVETAGEQREDLNQIISEIPTMEDRLTALENG